MKAFQDPHSEKEKIMSGKKINPIAWWQLYEILTYGSGSELLQLDNYKDTVIEDMGRLIASLS